MLETKRQIKAVTRLLYQAVHFCMIKVECTFKRQAGSRRAIFVLNQTKQFTEVGLIMVNNSPRQQCRQPNCPSSGRFNKVQQQQHNGYRWTTHTRARMADTRRTTDNGQNPTTMYIFRFPQLSSFACLLVSYATKRDATLGDVNVTITVGGLVICSVHIDPLIDANPIADKCRQMRRWYMTWRCDRFSTQWEQTETETQPTAKIPK
ncbi:conserved hypothetical protein [Trichinella spiralis]|uniref:Uncharacterized protein n=1 Tax=Trichinella spiralis TaxID=6334 RepID=E5SM11_TRISP|nr:conserved hypothetical protein [Trichinella spiralis]KRY29446.1 hypothetical protein T01_5811 [Trichinella spiralis]